MIVDGIQGTVGTKVIKAGEAATILTRGELIASLGFVGSGLLP